MVEDVVMCRLFEPFTTAERTLLERGRRDEVAAVRHAFQQETRVEFVEVVERLVGRRALAFISDLHVNPDMLIEIFFVEPEEAPSDPSAHDARG